MCFGEVKMKIRQENGQTWNFLFLSKTTISKHV